MANPKSVPHRNYTLDKSAMKALVTLHGPRGAARISGVPVGTVLSWSRKNKWKRAMLHTPSTVKTSSLNPSLQGKDAGDMLRESMENSRINSTLHLAKYTEKASEMAAKHKDPLEVARKVRDVAGVFQVLYPPEEESTLIEGSILIGAARVTDNVQEIEAHVKELEDVRQELPDHRPAGH
jgi:hypothetical protein